jgi:hypothetical protein
MEADSPTTAVPSKQSSSSSGKPEDLLVYVRRLRRDAEEFQGTIEEELRLTNEQVLDELDRQSKRRER